MGQWINPFSGHPLISHSLIQYIYSKIFSFFVEVNHIWINKNKYLWEHWYNTAGSPRAWWLLCPSDKGNIKPQVTILSKSRGQRSQYAWVGPAVLTLLYGDRNFEKKNRGNKEGIYHGILTIWTCRTILIIWPGIFHEIFLPAKILENIVWNSTKQNCVLHMIMNITNV